VRALPLYVAASNDLLCYETEDYASRVWCHFERLIAFKFMASGRVPWVVTDGRISEVGLRSGTGVSVSTEERLIVDPAECKLTSEADREPVDGLRACVIGAKAWTGGDTRPLVFGETTVTASVCTFVVND
jgi:hypothetical protein